MSLEVVLVVPVLMLLALFVLWAGRGGRAALITDLAAEEAATAAALVCEEGRPGCGELVSEVLRARPGLEFLCIGGPRPVPGSGGEILEEVWLDRGDFEVAAADSEVSALGVLGVSFVCETDGAVAPLRGVFPTVAFRGQASEVAVLQGPPRVGVDDVSVVEGTGGATTLTFTLTLDAPAPQDAVLTYSVVGGGYGGGQATAGIDFMPRSPMQVTISQGDMSAVVEVGIATDGLYEADETFELVFDPPPLSAGPGSVPVVNIPDRTAVGTIVNDDDLPAVTVGDVSGLETGRGLGFVVGLGAGVGRDVEIVLRTAVDARPGAVAATSGTSCTAPLETVRGNDPTDYIDAGAPATLTFTPGSALSQTVTVGQCDDLVGEPDETLLLRWGTVGVDPDDNPQSGVAVGTISDDEPRLRVDGDCGTDAIDAVSVSEGAGLLVFGVCRTRPNYPDSPADPVVRVRYRTVMHPSSGGRPAEAPGDYAAATGRLVFGASETFKTVAVTVVDDGLDEHDETLRLELFDPSDNASVEADPARRGVGTIRDDDDPPNVRVFDASAPETDDPNNPDDARLSFVVDLDAPSGKTVTVEYWTGDDAAPGRDAADAGADYTAVALPAPPTPRSSIDIAAGATTAEIAVVLVDDAVDEPDPESFVLRLAAFDARFESALDPCPLQQDDPLTTLVDEFVALGRDNCALGLIGDDDLPPFAVVADADADEGGDLGFVVGLFDAAGNPVTSEQEVTVGYQLEVGTALRGDFDSAASTGFDWRVDPPSGTLTIPAGTRERTVELRAAADNIYEPVPETFTLRLTGPVNARLHPEGNPCQEARRVDDCGYGRITESGDPPEVSVEAPLADTPEDRADPSFDGNVMNFRATLDKASTVDSTIRYRTVQRATAGAATGGSSAGFQVDYLTVPGTGDGVTYPGDAGAYAGVTYGVVTVPAGGRAAELPVRVFDDGVDESDETVHVELLAPRSGDNVTVDATADTATGAIADDDAIHLRFVDVCTDPGDVYEACADEGAGDMVFTVGLFDPITNAEATTAVDVTVGVGTVDGTAQAGSDFTAPAATATISANTETATISVPLIDDAYNEADETFQVVLRGGAGTFATIDGNSGQGAIFNDDNPPRVRIADAASVTEGGDAEFAVTLVDAGGNQVAAGQDVYINWRVEHRAADSRLTVTDADDFPPGGLTGTLEILKGVRDPVLAVPVAADTLFEGGTGAFEHFEVHLLLVTDSVDGTADLGGVTATLGPDGAAPCTAGDVADRCARGVVRDNDAEPVVRWVQAAGQAAGVGAAASEGTGGSGGELVFKVGLFDAVGGHAVRSGRDAVVSYSVGDLAAGEAVPSDPAGLSRAVGGTLTGGVWTPDDYDYEAVSAGSGSVTIRAGDETADLAAVAVRPDDVDETDEVLKATLLSAGGAALPPDADRRAWGVVTDDDVAELRLVDGCDHGDGDNDPGAADPEDPDNPGDHEGDFQACAREGSPLGFGVELSLEVSRTVSFLWWVQAPTTGHAATLPPAAGADVSAAGLGTETAKRPFSIAAGARSASIPVGTVDDDVFEADERLNLYIAVDPDNALNATMGDNISVGAVLNDDAAPRVRIADAASVTEGSPGSAGGPARFAVTLVDGDGDESPSLFDVYINWEVRHRAATGTAVTGDGDFAAGGLTGTLEIPAGDIAADLDVEVAADALYEGGTGAFEHFEVHLLLVTDRVDGTADLGGVTATLGPDRPAPCTAGDVADRCARGMVRDNDAEPVVRLLQAAGQAAGVGAAASEGTGGSGGELVFKVGLFDADNNAVRSGRDAVVAYSVGDLDNDGEIPSDPAGLSRAVGGTLTGGVWTPDDYDYAAVSAGSGSVTIRAGDETADLAAVAVRPDDVDETDEVLKATLLSAGGAALPPDADRRAWGVVTDDDVAELRLVDGCDHGDGDNDPGAADPEDPDNPGDHEGDFQACAEEGSPLGFGVELSLEVSRTVSFLWWVQAPTTGHAATLPPAAGADVSAAGLGTETAKRPFSIAAGARSASIPVGTVDDDVFEADERLNLYIAVDPDNALNATMGDNISVGAVLNDDAAPRVRIADAASVTEGSPGSAGGPARFAVTLVDGDGDESPSLFDVYINWEVRHRAATGTAVTGDDDFPAGGLTGTLEIPAGDIAADLDVEVAADALYEGGTGAFEHFEVHLLLVTDRVDGTADLGGVTASLGLDGAAPCAAGDVADRCARGLVRDNDAEPVVRLLQAAGQAAGVGAAASEGTGGSGGELVFKVGLFDADNNAVRSGRDAVVSYSVGDLDNDGEIPSDPAGLSRALGGTLTGGVWTPDDYDYAAVSAGSGSVTIRAGDETADLAAVAVRPDDVDETDEVLKATLLSAGGAALPPDADRRAWGVVTDDDVAELRLVDGCDHGDGDNDPGAADPEDPDNPGDHEGDFQACAEEGSPLGFGVELSLEVSRTVTFQWWVQAPTTGHAATLPPAAGADVSAAGLGTETAKRRFTIAAGTLSDSIGVGTVDDDVFEADERLNLRIEAIAGVDLNASLARGSAVGAVLNDDAAPRVRIADAASVTEGSPGSAGGPARFAVTLTDGDGDESPSLFDVYINWEVRHRAATGTAVTDDGDFPAGGLTGTLHIPAGDTAADLDVEVAADALYEGGTSAFEHFEVHLLLVTDSVDGTADLGGVTASLGPDGANPCAAGVVTDRCARGLVRDNDAEPVVRLLQAAGQGVAAVGAVASEGTGGSGGELVFKVGLFDAVGGHAVRSGRDAVVSYSVGDLAAGEAVPSDPAGLSRAVGGTLTGGVWTPDDYDYEAVSAGSGQVTIRAGDETADLAAVAVRPDDVDETDEVLKATLVSAGGAALPPDAADRRAWGVVTDDDVAELRLVDGCDHGDGDDDPGAADPEDPDNPGDHEGDFQACAEEGSPLGFGVELSLEVSRPVTFQWWVQAPTTGHAATLPPAAGADVSAAGLGTETAKRRFSIAAGTLSDSIGVGTVDDDVFEADERLNLRIEAIAGVDLNASLARGSAVGAVLNDDAAPRVRIADAASVTEGSPGSAGGPARFAVTLTDGDGDESPSIFDVYIRWEVRHRAATGTAVTDDGDFPAGGLTGTLEIPAGDTSADLDVEVAADALFEGGTGVFEHFEVYLLGVTDRVDGTADLGGVTASLGPDGADPCTAGVVTDRCARGLVRDNDAAPSLSVSAPAAAVPEGGVVEFTVSLSAPSGREASVDYATSVAAGSTVGQGAACGDDPASMPDLVEASGTLVFDPADPDVAARTSKTVPVQSCDDVLDEDEEAFELGLSGESGATLAAADAAATGLIADTDPAPRLGVAPALAAATEGEAVVFTVSLSAPSGRDAAVSYFTVHGRGSLTAGDGDYAAVPEASAQDLVFEPGEPLEQTVTIATTDDAFEEGEERFQLRLKDFANADRGDAVAVGAIRDECIDPAQTDPTADDYGAPTLSAAAAATVAEGDALTVAVALSEPLCVDAVLSARAAAGTAGRWDAPVTAAGEMVHARVDAFTLAVSLEAPTLQDAVFEGDETFTLHLNWNRDSDPYADVDPLGSHFPDIGGADDVAVTVTVVDDDPVPNVSVAAARAGEGDADIEFTVRLDTLNALPVDVNYWTRDLTGAGAATEGRRLRQDRLRRQRPHADAARHRGRHRRRHPARRQRRLQRLTPPADRHRRADPRHRLRGRRTVPAADQAGRRLHRPGHPLTVDRGGHHHRRRLRRPRQHQPLRAHTHLRRRHRHRRRDRHRSPAPGDDQPAGVRGRRREPHELHHRRRHRHRRNRLHPHLGPARPRRRRAPSRLHRRHPRRQHDRARRDLRVPSRLARRRRPPALPRPGPHHRHRGDHRRRPPHHHLHPGPVRHHRGRRRPGVPPRARRARPEAPVGAVHHPAVHLVAGARNVHRARHRRRGLHPHHRHAHHGRRRQHRHHHSARPRGPPLGVRREVPARPARPRRRETLPKRPEPQRAGPDPRRRFGQPTLTRAPRPRRRDRGRRHPGHSEGDHPRQHDQRQRPDRALQDRTMLVGPGPEGHRRRRLRELRPDSGHPRRPNRAHTHDRDRPRPDPGRRREHLHPNPQRLQSDTEGSAHAVRRHHRRRRGDHHHGHRALRPRRGGRDAHLRSDAHRARRRGGHRHRRHLRRHRGGRHRRPARRLHRRRRRGDVRARRDLQDRRRRHRRRRRPRERRDPQPHTLEPRAVRARRRQPRRRRRRGRHRVQRPARHHRRALPRLRDRRPPRVHRHRRTPRRRRRRRRRHRRLQHRRRRRHHRRRPLHPPGIHAHLQPRAHPPHRQSPRHQRPRRQPHPPRAPRTPEPPKRRHQPRPPHHRRRGLRRRGQTHRPLHQPADIRRRPPRLRSRHHRTRLRTSRPPHKPSIRDQHPGTRYLHPQGWGRQPGQRFKGLV